MEKDHLDWSLPRALTFDCVFAVGVAGGLAVVEGDRLPPGPRGEGVNGGVREQMDEMKTDFLISLLAKRQSLGMSGSRQSMYTLKMLRFGSQLWLMKWLRLP